MTFLHVAGYAALLALLVLGFLIYRALMSPELQYHTVWYKLKAKLFFWLGDIRRLDAFPFVTWASHEHKLDLKDVREACRKIRPGDIGIHRDSGYLSNLGIPGGFKHAWVCIDNNECVEAVSDGVVRRDNMYPLLTDYAIILRPLKVTKADIDKAVERAKTLEGCEYDANFNFDFEQTDAELERYTSNLKSGSFHGAFSCTETAAFCWYHRKKELGIFRSMQAGREAIVADDFLKMNFGIVWLSPTVTDEWAVKNGLHEEGRQKIKDFRMGRRDFSEADSTISDHDN